jgi:hypothetical protein
MIQFVEDFSKSLTQGQIVALVMLMGFVAVVLWVNLRKH